MSADSVAPTGDLIGSASERLAAPMSARERSFHAALAVAALLHASMFLNLGRSVPRLIGNENGSTDPIAVSIVSEKDFHDRQKGAVVPDEASGKPAQPAPPPAAEAPPPQEAKPETKAELVPELKPAIEPDEKPIEKTEEKPAEKAEAKPDPAPEKKPSELDPLALEKDNAELFKLPPPATSPSKPKQKADPEQKPPQKKPQKQIANLDLSAPPNIGAPSPPAGTGGASFARPPGITRSGANDDFARNVIRALQRTMPAHTGIFGRVTVRITLTPNGDIANVELLTGAKDRTLSDEVVFAARATTYPFPPPKSIPVDRIFLVTYIYE